MVKRAVWLECSKPGGSVRAGKPGVCSCKDLDFTLRNLVQAPGINTGAYLVLKTALRGIHNYNCPYFIDKETGIERLSNLPKVT